MSKNDAKTKRTLGAVMAVLIAGGTVSGCGGGGEETMIATTQVGWTDHTMVIKAADAVKHLESQGIHVFSYQCQVFNGVDNEGNYVAYVGGTGPVVVLATVGSSHRKKLIAAVAEQSAGNFTGPLAGYGYASPGKWWVGEPFDCEAAGF